MAEKIKITQKEFEEIYDIEKPVQEVKEESTPNASFEEFTEYFDEKEYKKMKENG